MKEENPVRAAMIKKAYYDLQQLSENNVVKAVAYIDGLKDKQDQMVKMIDLGIKMGE